MPLFHSTTASRKKHSTNQQFHKIALIFPFLCCLPLQSCSLQPVSGQFVCTEEKECPSGWVCVIGLCYEKSPLVSTDTVTDTASSSDGDIDTDTGTDTGTDSDSDSDSDSSTETDSESATESESNTDFIDCIHACIPGTACSTLYGTAVPKLKCAAEDKCCDLDNLDRGNFDTYCTAAAGCSDSCASTACSFYCNTKNTCLFDCPAGGCTMITAGTGASQFSCTGGGCTVAKLGDGLLAETTCQQGNCTVYCLGSGGCVLESCDMGNCSIENCSSKVKDCGSNTLACNADCP